MSDLLTRVQWQCTVLRELPLDTSEKIVLLALISRANEEDRCWPAYPTLARDTSLSVRKVGAVIRELVARGLVRAERPADRGVHTYTILVGHHPSEDRHHVPDLPPEDRHGVPHLERSQGETSQSETSGVSPGDPGQAPRAGRQAPRASRSGTGCLRDRHGVPPNQSMEPIPLNQSKEQSQARSAGSSQPAAPGESQEGEESQGVWEERRRMAVATLLANPEHWESEEQRRDAERKFGERWGMSSSEVLNAGKAKRGEAKSEVRRVG